MGNCVNSCVMAATYIHDKYNDMRFADDDNNRGIQFSTIPMAHKKISIHNLIMDRNLPEIKKLLIASSFEERQQIILSELNEGETPVHLACRLGYITIVHTLLDEGFPVDSCTSEGTPLHALIHAKQAGYLGDCNEIEVLMERMVCRHGCPVDGVAKCGRTALYIAAEINDVQSVRSLIRLDAAVGIADHHGFIPLYIAAVSGHLHCVNLLLSIGTGRACVNMVDSVGRTPLVSSLISILDELKKPVIESKTQDALIHKHSRIAIVEALLHAGASPYRIDHLGRTALMIAFQLAETDYLRELAISKMDDMSGTCTSSGDVESLYTPLVRLLVAKGSLLPDDWDSRQLSKRSDTADWLKNLYDEAVKNAGFMETNEDEVLSLVNLGRINLRSYLGSIGRLHQINQLPLPQELCNFLAMRYL